MELHAASQHLSRITTVWEEVHKAQEGPEGAANSAWKRLIQRYQGAVYRYLLASLRNPDAAEELAQDFAVKFISGAFRNADPQRGRFRDFLKRSLYHLMIDYRRRVQGQPVPLSADSQEPAADAEENGVSEREFLKSWRDELLARTWRDLAKVEARTTQPVYTVLRFRADHLDLSSTEMAEQLAFQLGRAFTADGVRQILHRARKIFAARLVTEVERSLAQPTQEELEQELIDLDLLKYAQIALACKVER